MKVNPVTPISSIPSQFPKKELTIHACCDNIEITAGDTIVMFGAHRFHVHVVFCKKCGSTKSTSYIKEQKK